MGKKYIIELEDKPFHNGNGDFLYRVKGFNSLVFDRNGLNMLTPYTEPDTEKVREEAFKNGYDAACKDIDIKSKTNAAYRKGLEDAWECARKIAFNKARGGLTYRELETIFGTDEMTEILDMSASEAIEKIRQYEQEKEEQIKVGDEVIPNYTITDPNPAIVTRKWKDNEGQDFVDTIGFNGNTLSFLESHVDKTGRHFPEIAEVLKKMREE